MENGVFGSGSHHEHSDVTLPQRGIHLVGRSHKLQSSQNGCQDLRASRRAEAGKARRSSRARPRNLTGLGSVIYYTQLYIILYNKVSCRFCT